MKPLVSIITVVLNCEEYIERTIKSVLSQTYDNIEYIIIDGNSTDNTVQRIKKYKRQISKFVSEPDSGIYDAMNKGIDLATGELVGLVNAGDWYEKNAIEDLVTEYNIQNKKEIVITGNQISCTYDGEKINKIRPYDNYEKMIKFTLPITHCATIVAKSIYDNYGMYDTKYKSSADMDFFLRIFVNQKIVPVYINTDVINIMPAATSYSVKGILETAHISLKYKVPTMKVYFHLTYKLFQQFIYRYLSFTIVKKIYHLISSRHLGKIDNVKTN